MVRQLLSCGPRPAHALSAVCVVVVMLAAGCRSTSAPTAPTPSPTPAPAPTVTLSGFVRDAVTSAPVANALVEVLTGASTGRGLRTDSTGAYRLTGLVPGFARTQASAPGFISDQANLDLASDTVHLFELRPVVP